MPDEVDSAEEPGRGNEVHDSLKEWDAMVDSTEEPGKASHVDCFSEKAETKHNDGPNKWVISWNEAFRREHEYQKKKKNVPRQIPDAFEALPLQHQEQTQNSCIRGTKRKAPSSLSYGECSKSKNKVGLLHKRSDKVITNSVSLLGRSPVSLLGRPPVDLLCKPPTNLLGRPGGYWQSAWYLPLLQKISQERVDRIVSRHLFIHGAQPSKKYRCHLCKVECLSLESLGKHQQSRMHKNQIELMLKGKKKASGSEVL